MITWLVGDTAPHAGPTPAKLTATAVRAAAVTAPDLRARRLVTACICRSSVRYAFVDPPYATLVAPRIVVAGGPPKNNLALASPGRQDFRAPEFYSTQAPSVLAADEFLTTCRSTNGRFPTKEVNSPAQYPPNCRNL